MKKYLLLSLILFNLETYSQNIPQQYKVFVWKFEMKGFKNQSDVINFENIFEDALKKRKYYQIFYVLLRKNYEDFYNLPDVEGVFKATKANTVVLGEIRSNNDYGKYDVRINFVHPNTTHSPAGGKISIPKDNFTNDSLCSIAIENFLDKEIVPSLRQNTQNEVNKNFQLIATRNNLINETNDLQVKLEPLEKQIIEKNNFSVVSQIINIYEQLIRAGVSLKTIYENSEYIKVSDDLDIDELIKNWRSSLSNYKSMK